MSEGLDELPPDVRAFLEPEQTIAGPPPASLARIHARLRAAIDAPISASPVPSSRAGYLATLGAGLLIGAALGVVGTLLWQRSPLPTDETPPSPVMQRAPAHTDDERTTVIEPVRVEQDTPSEPSAHMDTDEREVPRDRARPRPREPRSDAHAFERQMLDAARSSITRGHPAEGLTVLERHGREHPEGALAEERDALRVRALLELGRIDEAEREAERFFQAYPESLFRPGLRARLERAQAR